MTDKYSLQEENDAVESAFTTKFVMGCLIFTTTVAIIGLVLGASALAKSNAAPTPVNTPMAGGGAGGRTANKVINVMFDSSKKTRYFTIAHGHDWNAHEYVDQTGVVRGFSLELIKAVCKAADMKCFTIWEPYTNCWDSVAGQHPRTGKGLLARWYDGCMGWVVTVARNQSVGFTSSYMGMRPSFLFKNTSDTSFAWKDITGKKVGFLDGWSDDEKCLARQTTVKGSDLPVKNIKHYMTQREIINALTKGQVQAVFAGAELLNAMTDQEKQQITKGDTPFSCHIRGNGVMTRKDNIDFLESWNLGFGRVKANGVFRQLCDKANNQTKPAPIDCIKY